MTAFWLISPAMCLIIRWYLVAENKKRARALELMLRQQTDSEHEALDTGTEILELNDQDLDLTDRQQLRFVYPL